MGVVADLCSALAKLSGVPSENVRLLWFPSKCNLTTVLSKIKNRHHLPTSHAVINPYGYLRKEHVIFDSPKLLDSSDK